MTWTTDKPKEEGAYWYREPDGIPMCVYCYSIDSVDGPMIWEPGVEQDLYGNDMDGEWYGPIEVPE